MAAPLMERCYIPVGVQMAHDLGGLTIVGLPGRSYTSIQGGINGRADFCLGVVAQLVCTLAFQSLILSSIPA